MADATITVETGAASASFTIPDVSVQRIIPMVLAEYRQHHPGEDPTTIQQFAAGLWFHLKRDVLRHERQNFVPDDIDMGNAPESA